MKSIITRSVHAGLGLLGSGEKAVERLGKQLAQTAHLSEKEGEKIAQRLRSRSDKAIGKLNAKFQSEMKNAVNVLHSTLQDDVKRARGKSGGRTKG